MTITWKYVKELENVDNIAEVESLIEFKFPEDYVNTVKDYNGGRPNPEAFDTDYGKEYVFGGLLSFNKDDIENIFDDIDSIEFFPYELLVPVGVDPFGNYICYDKETFQLKFWEHETGRIEHMADSFTELLAQLYD